jgi:hypothetical protein
MSFRYRVAINNKRSPRSVPDDTVRAIRDLNIREGRTHRYLSDKIRRAD